MDKNSISNFKRLENAIAGTGGTGAFGNETAVECIKALFAIIIEMGLEPTNASDFRKGIYSIFNVELVNPPDLESNRYILAPNHVSDFDAVILGLLHPKIRIVSKTGWTDDERLRWFLDIHYDLCGLDRSSLQSLRELLEGAVEYFNSSGENRHFLIFSQGTISDFNNNSPERISTLAQKLSEKTGVPVVTVFTEQPSPSQPTRIVFDEPFLPTREDDFRTLWLERETAMQNALHPPARRPKLTHKHSNNNRPGDPFF